MGKQSPAEWSPPTELRRRAEAVAAEWGDRGTSPRWDRAALVRELQVTRAELVLLDESLRAAQRDLEEVRDRYRSLSEAVPVGFLMLDPAGRIVEANRAAEQLLGAPAEQLAGRALSTFVSEREAKALHIHLQAVAESRSRRRRELSIKRGAGTVPVRIESTVSGDEGVVSGYTSTLLDLTECRRAEEELSAATARSSSVLDTVAEAVVSADSRGRIEEFNAAAERLFGYTSEEVVDQDIGVLIRQQEGLEGDELIGVREDGSTFPMEMSVARWWDRGQRKYTRVIRDLTERRSAEREIREREDRFRQIARHVADVFVIRERRGGTVIYASPAFETVFGRRVPELYERSDGLLEWVEPDDREAVAEAFAAMVQGRPVNQEHRISRPDGEVRWVRARSFPVEEPDGSVERDVLVMQDITSERHLEQELAQAQKMEAVGALASGVAHDFNNVLQAVVGCLNLARSERTPPQEARAFLARAEDAARRGGELAGQLMSFARKRETTPVPVALDSLIKGSANLISRLVTEQVHLEIETGAPRCAILADAVQIEQILLNLAANARDAMPEGGSLTIRTDIEAGPHRDEDSKHSVRMVVRDTGLGMDEDTRARVFEPFFTTKDVGKGTGLGLSTVFAVTRRLGGRVRVESAPGEGTAFVFRFPCAVKRAAAAKPSRPEAVRFRGTALLVEDEPLVRTTVRRHLESLGLRVLAARDPADARELCEARADPVDLLVSDVILPVTRGPRFAAWMRERYPGLPVLFITANPESVPDHGPLSDVPVLRKPFGRDDLAFELARLLG